MHPIAVIQVMVLLAIANGAPLIAKKLFGNALAQPLDGGLRFFDGRPLLGPSKTIRGFLIAVVLTTLAAPLIGLELALGAVVAVTAMAGDILSSFIKRRMRLTSSSQATGIDQIPEALLPLLAVAGPLSLTLADILVGVAVFFFGEVVLSRVFYRLGLRDQPY